MTYATRKEERITRTAWLTHRRVCCTRNYRSNCFVFRRFVLILPLLTPYPNDLTSEGRKTMKRIDVSYANGSFLEDLLRFLRRRKIIREQKTFCWCPTCKEDLCSNNSFNPDSPTTVPVQYECTNCGTRSEWDFNHPAPILLRAMPK